jgi:hypothetical protein
MLCLCWGVELGASVGGLASLVHFTIDYVNTIRDVADVSTVRNVITGSQIDNQWSWGAFGGVDVRLRGGVSSWGGLLTMPT